MDSPRRRQPPALKLEEAQQQEGPQSQSQPDVPPGVRHYPYPDGDGYMIIVDGFNR